MLKILVDEGGGVAFQGGRKHQSQRGKHVDDKKEVADSCSMPRSILLLQVRPSLQEDRGRLRPSHRAHKSDEPDSCLTPFPRRAYCIQAVHISCFT